MASLKVLSLKGSVTPIVSKSGSKFSTRKLHVSVEVILKRLVLISISLKPQEMVLFCYDTMILSLEKTTAKALKRPMVMMASDCSLSLVYVKFTYPILI